MYAEYQRLLLELNLLDFDDVIALVSHLLCTEQQAPSWLQLLVQTGCCCLLIQSTPGRDAKHVSYMQAVRALSDEAVRQRAQRRAMHLLVDEMQDCSPIQVSCLLAISLLSVGCQSQPCLPAASQEHVPLHAGLAVWRLMAVSAGLRACSDPCCRRVVCR